ncbi:hypothetical protein B0H14DRAFT_3743513 [Mycena olivaceomarginata]|nr:hypothetical protein B0H14DRAFT_3743513 [Mycena olivaceomarginata]
MDWDDTVGSHGLAALSRITLSVSLLGGATNRSSHSLREPSARYKAAVETEKDQSDDEPAQRKKRKRKTALPRVAKPANLNVDAEESTSGEDFVVDDDEASSESTDSEVGLTVEGEEAAGVLPSKTNPKSSRTRSKGKEKAAPKKKQKTAAPSDPIQPEAGVSPSEPSAKATRKPPPVKKNAIWNFFEYIPQPDVQNPIKDAKYYKCHLGKALVPITAGANGNVTPLRNHLKTHFPDYWRMYLVWNEKGAAEPPAEDLLIAKGEQPMTPEMGEDVEKELKALFAANESNFSVSLDAWTSSNGHAFVAIVAHWIDNNGKLRSAVAVERVFSGGRDTTALRRAKLKPETIRTLMILKAHIRLARKEIIEVLDEVDIIELE